MSGDSLFSSEIQFVASVPASHLYYNDPKPETYSKKFKTAWKRDLKILQNGLPSGIHVKFFEDRMDLISLMIKGPTDTPYEGCLFFFDVILPSNYPNQQPRARYIKYHENVGQIHPNIFRDGTICLSLLNQSVRRASKYSIYWMPNKSSLLQLFVSLQGLVLAKDPLNNIALKPHSRPNIESQAFNTQALVNVVQSMATQIENPPEIWATECLEHYQTTGMDTYRKLRQYTSGFVTSLVNFVKRVKVDEPAFPLMTPLPANLLDEFIEKLERFE